MIYDDDSMSAGSLVRLPWLSNAVSARVESEKIDRDTWSHL